MNSNNFIHFVEQHFPTFLVVWTINFVKKIYETQKLILTQTQVNKYYVHIYVMSVSKKINYAKKIEKRKIIFIKKRN